MVPFSVVAVLLVVAPATAQAQLMTFRIEQGGESQATFVSDAPLDRIEGHGFQLSGTISFDPTEPTTTKGKFQILVAALRTGIDLRDEHLRGENWLNAEKNPHATFEIIKVLKAPRQIKADRNEKVRVLGRFTVNGVAQNVVTSGILRWLPSKRQVRIKADFTVHLEDHKVSVPLIVRVKISDEIKVHVDIRAVAVLQNKKT